MIKQKIIVLGMSFGILFLIAQMAVSGQVTISSVFPENDPNHRMKIGLYGATWLATPDWSPDGKEIVFCFIQRMTGNTDIWIVDINGTYVRKLTNSPELPGWEPKWSPDGSKIAFTRGSNMWTMKPDGSDLIQLTNDDKGYSDFSWSPDGTKILFYKWDDSNKDILWIMNSDGTNQRHLVTGGAVSLPIEWTNDNTKIAFNSTRGGNSNVWTINIDGTGLTKLSNYQGTSLRWSPDGTKIAAIDHLSAKFRIISSDGSNRTELDTGDVVVSGSDQRPSWSADGKKILFLGYNKGNDKTNFYILTLPLHLQAGPWQGSQKSPAISQVKNQETGYISLKAFRAANKIVIGGKLSEWQGIDRAMLDEKQYITYKPANWQGKDDLSAELMAQYDDENLYLAIKVTDDKFVQQFRGDEMLKGDHVELWFGTEKGTYQFGLSPGDFKGLKPEAVLWLPNVSSDNKQKVLKGIKVDSQRIEAGYNVEVKIPLANIGITKETQSVRFTLVVSDTDDAANPEQDSLLTSSKLKWNKPETFGELAFK